MTTYRERRLAKAERLRGWADKREEKGDAAVEQARSMASVIPFGQPIIVGHHSEGADRRYRGRIDSKYERGVADLDKAESMRSRADHIEEQAAGAIYSDDPDAVEQLRARIADLEVARERVKAENAAFRKAHPELRAMTAYQRDQAMPHAGYVLSNLSGNIKRNRDRLVVLKAQAARQEGAAASEAGVVVKALTGGSEGYVAVTFAEKPAVEVRDALKAAGYYFRQGSWWGKADVLPEGIGTC